jgi:hypothetical protein
MTKVTGKNGFLNKNVQKSETTSNNKQSQMVICLSCLFPYEMLRLWSQSWWEGAAESCSPGDPAP